MSKSNVQICALQGGPCSMDQEKNVQQHVQYLENAILQAPQKPNIICFSEYTTIPSFACVEKKDYFTLAEELDGPTTQAFAKIAKQHGVYLIYNIFEKRAEGLYYNSCPLLGPDGNFIKGYFIDGTETYVTEKLHLPNSLEPDGSLRNNEKFYFHPGKLPVIFPTPWGNIANIICWDKRFSELWRTYGLKDVSIVFNPAATWGGWRGETYAVEMRAMAMMNQYYVVGVGKAGLETCIKETDFAGGGIIVAPNGAILAQANPSPGKAIYANLCLEQIKQIRQQTPIYRDRRPEIYQELLK